METTEKQLQAMKETVLHEEFATVLKKLENGEIEAEARRRLKLKEIGKTSRFFHFLKEKTAFWWRKNKHYHAMPENVWKETYKKDFFRCAVVWLLAISLVCLRLAYDCAGEFYAFELPLFQKGDTGNRIMGMAPLTMFFLLLVGVLWRELLTERYKPYMTWLMYGITYTMLALSVGGLAVWATMVAKARSFMTLFDMSGWWFGDFFLSIAGLLILVLLAKGMKILLDADSNIEDIGKERHR